MDMSPQSMALAPLFDTFTHDLRPFGLLGGTNPPVMAEFNVMNDSLFGFMNGLDLQTPLAWEDGPRNSHV